MPVATTVKLAALKIWTLKFTALKMACCSNWGRIATNRPDEKGQNVAGVVGIPLVLAAHRQGAVRVDVVVHRQGDLLEVVGALGPPRRLARRLDRRQEQGDQDAHDRDDDQQLDQGEARPAGRPRLAKESETWNGPPDTEPEKRWGYLRRVLAGAGTSMICLPSGVLGLGPKPFGAFAKRALAAFPSDGSGAGLVASEEPQPGPASSPKMITG